MCICIDFALHARNVYSSSCEQTSVKYTCMENYRYVDSCLGGALVFSGCNWSYSEEQTLWKPRYKAESPVKLFFCLGVSCFLISHFHRNLKWDDSQALGHQWGGVTGLDLQTQRRPSCGRPACPATSARYIHSGNGRLTFLEKGILNLLSCWWASSCFLTFVTTRLSYTNGRIYFC